MLFCATLRNKLCRDGKADENVLDDFFLSRVYFNVAGGGRKRVSLTKASFVMSDVTRANHGGAHCGSFVIVHSAICCGRNCPRRRNVRRIAALKFGKARANKTGSSAG